MESNAVNGAATGQASSAEPLQSSKVLEEALSLWHELHQLGHDHFLLAALETRRAGESLVTMLVAAIVLAFLLISAWLGLLAAAVLGLIENGMAASRAILLSVVFNLLLVLIVYGVIRRKSYYLQFPAILGNFQPKSRNTESS
jgi:hypothetical protein